MSWNVLNYVPPRGTRRDGLRRITDRAGVELFAPTFVELNQEEGKVNRKEKPLLYHYIFVRGEEEAVKRLCLEEEGFSYVVNRGMGEKGLNRHVKVSDGEMEQFRTIADYYAGKLPCYPLEGVRLEEGDRVQVVDGPCAGLTGTYMSRKGAKSGNILVAIDSQTAAIVYDIRAEYVRVLEFAKDSKRLYDQLDAFSAKIEPYIETGKKSVELLAAATVFARRLGETRVDQPKTAARLAMLLAAAFRILGDREREDWAKEKYRKLAGRVTGEKTRRLANLLDIQ